MAVRVVTDSTADLAPEVADELGITVIPLSVILGTDAFKDGVEIKHDQFYERLAREDALPTTSAPSVGDFQSVYESFLKEGDSILSIHLSSKLSVTHDSALQAARQLSEDGRLIRVVDSRSISMALAFIVRSAAKAAKDGATLDEVASLAERSVPQVHLYFILNTLEYVRRGGRIGHASALLGTMLKIKPILTLRNGEIFPEEKVRTRSKGLERLAQLVTNHPKPTRMAVAYSTNREEADSLRHRLAGIRPGIEVDLTRLSPVIGTHTGPGVLGAGLIQDDN